MNSLIILKSIFIIQFLNVALSSERNVSHRVEKIIGGKPVEEGEIPYIVSVRFSENRYHFCGGAIIKPNKILTAGVCCDRKAPSQLTIVYGSNDLYKGGESRGVSKIKIHEEYNSDTSENDLCVMTLKSPINFGKGVSMIELAGKNDGPKCAENTPSCGSALFAGWGIREPGGGTPNDLNKISLPLIPTINCIDRLPLYVILYSNICTSGGMGKGLCFGDVGGPLTKKINGQNKLIGVFGSFDTDCGQGRPDVFTRVSHYYDWINKQL